MRRAIALAYEGMAGKHGGPFGAVIVRDGKIIGEGHNRVLSSTDPTAHAEVTAIRDASAKAKNFDLSGSEIYVNGLPCPMCMAAIFWARIGKVFYGCSPADAEAIGFDDQEFYRELAKPPEDRAVPAVQMEECHAEARACYQAWAETMRGSRIDHTGGSGRVRGNLWAFVRTFALGRGACMGAAAV